MRFGDRAAAHQRRRRRREQTSDFLVFDERRHANHEFAKCLDRPDALERRQAVEGYASRLELFDDRLYRDQPIFKPRDLRIVAHHPQHPVAFHLLEVETPTARVPKELLSAFLEREEQATLARDRTTLKELRNGERLPCARRAGHE